MFAIRQQRPCDLYSPGHRPHWIQARKGWEDQENRPRPGRLLDASTDGLITLEIAGEEVRFWNHDPLRLREAAALENGAVLYQARWRLLSAGGGYLFCAAVPPENHVACQVLERR